MAKIEQYAQWLVENQDKKGTAEFNTVAQAYTALRGGIPTEPEPKPRERTFGEAAKDIGAGVVSGTGALVQLPGQLYGLATGDFEETGALGLGKKIAKAGEEMKSEVLKRKEEERAKKVQEAEKQGQFEAFKAALGETVTDPALLFNFLAEQAPQLLVPFGAAKGAKAIVAGKALSDAAKGAVATGAAVGAGGVQQGADIGAQSFEDIYKELLSKGSTPDEAKAGAINLARSAGAGAAVISLLAQRLPGGRTIEEAFAGVKGTGGRLIGGIKGAAGETASEITEEVGGKLGQNIAMQQVKPEQQLTAGLGETAAMAAIGGAGLGGATGVLRRPGIKEEPPVEAPVETKKVEEPPVEAAPKAPAPKDLEGEFVDYFSNMPEGSDIVFQNRDRSTQASIAQMQSIAANPDYSRVSESKDFGTGAPVVISDIDLSESPKISVVGKKSEATLPNGERVPVMYAVVDSPLLQTSNDASGTTNPDYADLSRVGLRAIAGNGRIAGIKQAYEKGTADNYRSDLINDLENLGIDTAAVQGMESPVLVRVMPKSYLTPDIADLSNRGGIARLSPIDTAKNDVKRFALDGVTFNEDGTPDSKSIMQFINAMPVEERPDLTDDKGQPTAQAYDRMANAIFQQAYNSDTLIKLYAQAADPEAKTILNALARVAPKMAQLEGAGDYDVREAVVQAAEAAVNARRRGVSLKDFASQKDIEMDPNAGLILDMFADNSRSARKIADNLDKLADTAIQQTEAGPDMFGEKPKLSLTDVYKVLQPAEGAPVETADNKRYEISKSKEQIAKEIDGLTIPELSQWAIDNAPNAPAKAIAEAVHKRMAEYEKRNMFGIPVSVRNDFMRFRGGTRGVTKYAYGPRGIKFNLSFNGLVNGKADRLTGANYITILHELLHVATTAELQLLAKDSALYNDLNKVLAKVRKQIREDKAAGVKHPLLDGVARGANTVKNVKELVSWGMTDPDFQDYLSKIQFGKKNGFGKLVELFRKMLGLDQQYETALEAVARTTETILNKPIEELSGEVSQKGFRLIGSEAVGKEIPKLLLRTDNPGGSWLAGKRADALARGKNNFGNPKSFGTVTGYFRGEGLDSRYVMMPVDVLSKIEGVNAEQKNVRKDDLEAIKKIMSETNRLPQHKGEDYVPFITVFQDGTPYVSEGNHRIMAAKELGFKYIPVEIRYYNGAEQESGITSPDKVKAYDEKAHSEGFSQEKYGAELKGEEESRVGEAIEKGKQAVTKALQKRKVPEGAMSGLPQDLVNLAQPIFFPKNETIIQKIEGLQDGFWKRMAQGIADQYRSIKDISPEAYMLARLSRTTDGALEGLLFNGHVFNDGGALNIKQGTKGLMEAMKPIGQEVDRYQMWIALNREAALPAEKRSKFANIDELIKRRNEFAEGEIDGKSRLEVYKQVQKDMNAINKSVLNVALQTGLIDQDSYDRFAADINYIPFYRQMENGDLGGAATSSGLTNQYFSRELKGGERPYGDLMENTLRNWSHILSSAMKNQAAFATLNAATRLGAAEPISSAEKGAVKVMIDGKPQYYKVSDPMLLESISAIGYVGPKSMFLDVARDFKNMLQFGVTISPAFKIRNLFRDSVSALAVTDLKKNPFANVIEGWMASDKNNPAHISALAGGAIFNFGTAYEGDQSKLIKRLLDSGVDYDNILDSPEKVKQGLSMLWNKYQEWGNKSEAANRMALYNQMREKGMSHLEATFYAKDLLDFSMQGSWGAFRLASQTIPFLNARIQGLYKLGRDGILPTTRVLYNTVTNKPIDADEKKKALSFGITTSAVALASMLLYLAYKDDEEFQKREAWDRDNFWWIKLPGMDAALRIPKPFEIGAFGTMAERTLEQIIDQGSEGKQFGDSLKRILTDTFAINPTPQVIRPLYDIYANKDSFTGAPIESAGMERLSKQERATDATSPIAKLLGGVTGIFGEKAELSPVQIDYAIKAYFGWLGGTATEISKYAVMPFNDGAYPDTRWVDKVSQGFIKELPATQSGYVTAFYENNKQISQAYADMRHYAELGNSEKVAEKLEKDGDKIGLAKLYDKTSKEIANVRKQIRVIQADTTLDGTTKREMIDNMKFLISELAKNAEEVRKASKNP